MSMTPPLSSFPDSVLTIIDVNDQNAKEVGIELFQDDVVKLDRVPLRARRIILRLSSIVLIYHSSNVRVRTCTNLSPEAMAYAVFGPAATGTVNGLPVRSGVMLAAAPESEVRFVVDEGWESVSIFVPKHDISEHIAIRQRLDKPENSVGIELIDVNPVNADTLFLLGKTLIHSAVEQPELFTFRETERISAQVEIMELLLTAICSGNPLTLTRGDRTKQKQFTIVKIAEQLALTHTGVDLYVTDLCKAAAVSERTLEYAFKEIIGLTPVAYIKQLRLHRVYQSLLHSLPGTTTVSEVAMDWGFWHLGELSKAYKTCFNELPSDTLSRGPDNK